MKIAFFGHKPQDMGGFDGNELQSAIKTSISDILLKDKSVTVVTGLHIGIEMWAAGIAAAHKIPYEVYIPFQDPHQKWPFPVRKTYTSLLKTANKKIVMDEGGYDIKKLIAKELKIIEEADIIYSFFKEEPAILKKAMKQGKKVINMFPKEEDDFFIPF
jgi:uncharacterized phage-like protein YoqJ